MNIDNKRNIYYICTPCNYSQSTDEYNIFTKFYKQNDLLTPEEIRVAKKAYTLMKSDVPIDELADTLEMLFMDEEDPLVAGGEVETDTEE